MDVEHGMDGLKGEAGLQVADVSRRLSCLSPHRIGWGEVGLACHASTIATRDTRALQPPWMPVLGLALQQQQQRLTDGSLVLVRPTVTC